MPASTAKPVALSIAGFDPSGAAGVLADLKSFAAHDCYGVAAVAALEISPVSTVDSTALETQLQALFDDVAVAGIKIGLLGSRRNMEVVAKFLHARPALPVVLDGDCVADPEVLLRRSRIFTPSSGEAGRLLGLPISTLDEMKGAAKLLQERGVPHVVVRGTPADVYYDGHDFEVFHNHRGDASNPPGAGDTFSSALLANLIHGKPVKESIVLAKAYVTQAIARSYPIGNGPGPLNHLFRFAEPPIRVPAPDLVHEVPHH